MKTLLGLSALITTLAALNLHAAEPRPFKLYCETAPEAKQRLAVLLIPGSASVSAPGLLASTVDIDTEDQGTTFAVNVTAERGDVYVSNQNSFESVEKLSLHMTRIEPENLMVTHYTATLTTQTPIQTTEDSLILNTRLTCTFQ